MEGNLRRESLRLGGGEAAWQNGHHKNGTVCIISVTNTPSMSPRRKVAGVRRGSLKQRDRVSHSSKLELIQKEGCWLLNWPGGRGELPWADSDVLGGGLLKMNIRDLPLSHFSRGRNLLSSGGWAYLGILVCKFLRPSQGRPPHLQKPGPLVSHLHG